MPVRCIRDPRHQSAPRTGNGKRSVSSVTDIFLSWITSNVNRMIMQMERTIACRTVKPVSRGAEFQSVTILPSIPMALLMELARKISMVMAIRKSVRNVSHTRCIRG